MPRPRNYHLLAVPVNCFHSHAQNCCHPHKIVQKKATLWYLHNCPHIRFHLLTSGSVFASMADTQDCDRSTYKTAIRCRVVPPHHLCCDTPPGQQTTHDCGYHVTTLIRGVLYQTDLYLRR